jgi:hypothetical protein
MNDELQKAVDAVKDPSSYSLLTYAWVVVLSAWGGVVRVLQTLRDRPEDFRRVMWQLLIGVFTSIFVGVITFFLCESAHMNPLWTAVCVAVTGHMGAEGLHLLRALVKRNLSGLNIEPEKPNAP